MTQTALEVAMIYKCPICTKEHQASGYLETEVPVVKTCNFCKFKIFIYKNSAGEIHTDDAEWREILLSIQGKERIIKKQLEEIDNALFFPQNRFDGKYKKNITKTLLKKYEKLKGQYILLTDWCNRLYNSFFHKRWNEWTERYRHCDSKQ